MTKILFDLFIIGISLTYIIDLSGVTTTLRKIIWRIRNRYKPMPDDYDPKPFTCSLCTTFWLSLAYLIIMGKLSLLTFLFACANSYLTTAYSQLMITGKMIVDKMFELIQRMIERI